MVIKGNTLIKPSSEINCPPIRVVIDIINSERKMVDYLNPII